MSLIAPTAGSPPHRFPGRHIAAVGLGNALEFYDFLTFSFFAVQIGRTFFPASQTSHGLLFTLMTFGGGFLTRPLGALVIGVYGDRVGRRPAMVLSFSLMGLAILGLALIPSYAEIGGLAPLLLVLCRLLQGFALGGEVGPSTAFLVESAPAGRRGFYVSLQYMTQDLAVLVAGLVGFAMSSWLSPGALDSWGWRGAFLIGILVVPIGIWMRSQLPETLRQPDLEAEPGERARAVPVSLVVLALMLMLAAATYIYGLDYFTTYAQDSLHLSPAVAFGATVIIGLGAAIADPVSGLLTDRVGRKPVMIGAAVVLVLALVPAFVVVNHSRSVIVLYLVTGALAVMQALLTVPILVTITESLPKAVRSGALGLIYAAGIALFGGSTQFAVKGLIDLTQSPIAPAWYITGAVFIGAVAMCLIRETSPTRLSRP